MKKTLFIAIQYLEIGGAERSLIGLLDSIDYSRYEVDLFVYRHSGEFMKFIPSSVNLLPEIPAYTTLTRPIAEIIKEGYWAIAAGRLWAKLKASKTSDNEVNASIFQYVAAATTRFLPAIQQKEYDLAISFIHPHNIVAQKVKAKKKAAWIHTDYSTVKVDTKAELPVWDTFDHIVAISGSSKEAFQKSFPTLEKKLTVIENILSSDFVREQAKATITPLDGEIKLLTVGRFCYPKAFDHAVRICAELVKRGVPIKWYAIGYGDQQPLQNAIKECRMQNHFIILGKKDNPYPYMASCDLYVQPSRYEGKAVTVREAQMLHKPVVITAFPTANSQLTHGFDGVIVPMDLVEAAKGLKAVIENKELQNQLIENTRRTDYGNQSEVQKIYRLI